VVLRAGHHVVAVYPSTEMLAQLAGRLPGVATEVGGAEAVPLPDGSVDAVVAGQAAHWFEPAPTAAELRRVLRPGGVVGFVWNTRDERVPWVGALGELLAAESRDHEADQTVVEEFAAALPASVEVFDSGIVQSVGPEQVVGGIGTRSYVATMDAARREEFLGRVAHLLATHPDTRGRGRLELPYRTRAYRLTPA
jgi:SAM-dependent methyltransferase